MRSRPRRRHLIGAGNQIYVVAVSAGLTGDHGGTARRHGTPAGAVRLSGTRAKVISAAGLRGNADADIADGIAGLSGYVHAAKPREDMLEGQRVLGLVGAIREVRAHHVRGVRRGHGGARRRIGQRAVGRVKLVIQVRGGPNFPALINSRAGTRHLRELTRCERAGLRTRAAGHGRHVERRQRGGLRGAGGCLGLGFDIRISAEDDLVTGKVLDQHRLLQL